LFGVQVQSPGSGFKSKPDPHPCPAAWGEKKLMNRFLEIDLTILTKPGTP